MPPIGIEPPRRPRPGGPAPDDRPARFPQRAPWLLTVPAVQLLKGKNPLNLSLLYGWYLGSTGHDKTGGVPFHCRFLIKYANVVVRKSVSTLSPLNSVGDMRISLMTY